jgi:hypothetical protein
MAYPETPWFGNEECTLSDLFDQCFFAVGTAIKKDALESAGGFASDLYAEDYYVFLRLLACGHRHRYINQPLASHRRSRSQRSACGLEVREADLASIERIACEFFLTDQEQHAFEVAHISLKRNIRIRKFLYCFFGSSTTEWLIGMMRRGI